MRYVSTKSKITCISYAALLPRRYLFKIAVIILCQKEAMLLTEPLSSSSHEIRQWICSSCFRLPSFRSTLFPPNPIPLQYANNLVLRNQHGELHHSFPIKRWDFVCAVGDNSAWTLRNFPHPFIQYAPPLSPTATAKAIYILSLIGSMTQKMKIAAEESRKVSAETQTRTCWVRTFLWQFCSSCHVLSTSSRTCSQY